MSCYHPRLMVPTGKFYSKTGKPIYEFIKEPEDRTYLEAYENGVIRVPCGKCLGCRLDYSRQWADRMMLELQTAGKAVFVTLTYDNEHIPIYFDGDDPVGYTVYKKDCQDFMKNLRRDYDGKDGHPYAKIRFYLTSEYGTITKRPHYHCILFGLGLDDFPLRVFKGMNEFEQPFYDVPELKAAWPKGFVTVSEVSWATCAYVARYTLKKVFEDQVNTNGFEMGVDPEFSLMSRRPGIGADYLNLHDDCLDYQNISVKTGKGAHKLFIPNYYLRKVKENCILPQNPKYDKLFEDRKRFASDAALMKMSRISLSYIDQLELEEEKKLRSLNPLKRHLDV